MRNRHSRSGRAILLAAVIASAITTTLPARADDYTLQDVSRHFRAGGELGGSSINDRGQIAGTRRIGDDWWGVVTGPHGRGARQIGITGQQVEIYDLDDAGRLVGSMLVPELGQSRPFVTADDGQTLIDLGTLGGTYGDAVAINAAGQIAGLSTIPAPMGAGQYPRATFTTRDAKGLRDLGTLGGTMAEATAINASGVVVGWALDATGTQRGFMTGPDGVGMRQVDDLGGDFTLLRGVNAAGVAVGVSKRVDGAYAGLVTGPGGVGATGVTTDDGLEVSFNAINTAGCAVGEIWGPPNAYYAVLRDPQGALVRLNKVVPVPAGTGWLESAIAINDRGQILVSGLDRHVFVLTPTHGQCAGR